MKVNEILMKESTTIKSVAGDKVTLDVDGKAVDTTKDALIPGAKPGTIALKPDATGNALKPGMTVTSDTATSEAIKADNFTAQDLKGLEHIKDLDELKAKAFELISTPSKHPMKPEKIEWFKGVLDRASNPMQVIKLMYDLLLSGEGHGVVGSKGSMKRNSYRDRFSESAELNDIKKLSGL